MGKKIVIGGIDIDVPWRRLDQAGLVLEFVPRQVAVPLAQGSGKPAEAVVEVGQEVRLGQLIGEATEKSAARAHASVSGTVERIGDTPTAGGEKKTCVWIRNDYKNTTADPIERQDDGEGAPSERIIDMVKKAGVIGMGGAMFPSGIKLKVERGSIDWCLLNGAKCEPLVESDSVLMVTATERVIRGAALIRQATGARQVAFCIEEDKSAAIETLTKAVGATPDVSVIRLPHHYPMGGEKQLILYVTGREVPEGCLPSDIGVVVFNVGTATAIADAVDAGKALTHRLCTVCGDVVRPAVLRVPIGSLAEEVLEFCGGASSAYGKVIMGGPMMGKALARLDVPLHKGANSVIVVAPERDRATLPEHPCIRCDRCSEVCPMRLMPQLLDRAQRRDDMAACRRLKATSCINCGCCTYICPSRIPLARNITAASSTVKKMKESGDDGK
ncbi:MAG: electron transport complex subunit RsxC [Planctomycetaceae bacterium]|nr:electron transport complex subunit RsxC [Planctomycetaceae bacterium]